MANSRNPNDVLIEVGVKAITDLAKFGIQKAFEPAPPKPSAVATTASSADPSRAKVVIYRYWTYAGGARRWTVWFDDVKLAKIHCNEYMILYVAPGRHTFFLEPGKSAVSEDFQAGRDYYVQIGLKFFSSDHDMELVTAAAFRERAQKLEFVPVKHMFLSEQTKLLR